LDINGKVILCPFEILDRFLKKMSCQHKTTVNEFSSKSRMVIYSSSSTTVIEHSCPACS
jgi:hypothetical protein